MVLESISRIIKVQLPAYLKRLPLPETIGGFARLTGKEGGCAACEDDFSTHLNSAAYSSSLLARLPTKTLF